MSVLKQLAIHNFSAAYGLPVEMSHEIMGFCFYDTVTAVFRAVHKANVAQVMDHFDNAYCSRARPIQMVGDPDTCEHWAICLTRMNGTDHEIQFQAINCRVCGNYKHCHTFRPTEEQFIEAELAGIDLPVFLLEDVPLRMRCCCQH
jgi:hypothetical protein